MKRLVWGFAGLFCLAASAQAQVKINPTDPQPTCQMCPGTYIPLSEIENYQKKALAEKLLDQQVRDIDIGKANIGIGIVHRGKFEKPAPDFGRRTRPDQRSLSCAFGCGDAGARPRYRQPAAAACDHAHGRQIQRSWK